MDGRRSIALAMLLFLALSACRAITAVGESMEALGLQLREPCPEND